MLRLAIDTSGSVMSIAIASDGKVIAEKFSESGVRVCETINQLIADTVQLAGVSLSKLTDIVVGLGPGSFTGVRAGIATALGLATGLSIKLGGANVLLALAMSEIENSPVVVFRKGSIAEYFAAAYSWSGNKGESPVELVTPRAVLIEDLQHDLTDLLQQLKIVIEPSFIDLDVYKDSSLASCLAQLPSEALQFGIDLRPTYIKAVNAKTLAERQMKR